MLKLPVKNRVYLIYIALLLYGVILVIFTILPDNILFNSNSPDKVYHFAAYVLLSIITYFALISQKKFSLLKKYPGVYTLLLTFLFGVLNEIVQIFVPGRRANVLDVMANFCGALISIIVIKIFLGWQRNKKKAT